MYANHKVIVVLPAYNAASTVLRTCREVLEQPYVDGVILVDDASQDETAQLAATLDGVTVHRHAENLGYGANQKTCYRLALEAGAGIVIMVHPDYQYSPRLIAGMVRMIGDGEHHCVIGSRILGGRALAGGMPRWRYVGNRFLTTVQNWLTGARLSEYHTGYRAFSRTLLQQLPLQRNSNDFVFDNQVLAQILWRGFSIAEISCPTSYHAQASSIGFAACLRYGFGCLGVGARYWLARKGWFSAPDYLAPARPEPAATAGSPGPDQPPAPGRENTRRP